MLNQHMTDTRGVNYFQNMTGAFEVRGLFNNLFLLLLKGIR